MLFQPVKKAQNRQFEYKARHIKKEKEERTISFREQHIFDTTDSNLAGKLREFTHVKRPKKRTSMRSARMMLILLIMGVIYFIYSDNLSLRIFQGDEIAKSIVGFFILMVLLILFINKSKKV